MQLYNDMQHVALDGDDPEHTSTTEDGSLNTRGQAAEHRNKQKEYVNQPFQAYVMHLGTIPSQNVQ